ncbi:hypothetical protein BGX28_001895 [Mortierella sp. GBA30]|nr:hypothetical protein BGX28_001895 [Mortierella sp. GBA30]
MPVPNSITGADHLPLSVRTAFKAAKAFALVALGASFMACAVSGASNKSIDFVFAEDGDLSLIPDILQRPDIHGAQMIYTWKQLEKSKGVYDFSGIESDLKTLDAVGKKLFVQIQDRFDVPGNQSKRIPNYLLVEQEYEGGLLMQKNSETHLPDGWQTKHWVPAVRKRFQALLYALAQQFDGKIYGLNLPETAFDHDGIISTTLCDKYFDAEMENVAYASSVFNKSVVVQYMNFWPCETPTYQPYMKQAFPYAIEKKFGLGGPDVKPWNAYQLQNSYHYFHQYKGQLSHVAMAVQQPDLGLINPRTNKTYTVEDFRTFSEDYLGSDIMFWTSYIFNQTAPVSS